MRYFEKQAIDSSPTMRLGVRLKKLYGLSTPEAIRTAKRISKAIKPKMLDNLIEGKGNVLMAAFIGAFRNTNRRTDILQDSLRNTSKPSLARFLTNRFKG